MCHYQMFRLGESHVDQAETDIFKREKVKSVGRSTRRDENSTDPLSSNSNGGR